MLHGHERSITQIKYNRDGDLLFSAAKDTKPNVWYSLNGERLGTYNGHGGAVWCIDVDCILEKITLFIQKPQKFYIFTAFTCMSSSSYRFQGCTMINDGAISR